MLVMVVMVMMLTLFFTMYGYCHMCSRYTAFHRFFSGELNVWDTEFIKLFYKFFTVGDKLKKCRCKHIACRTHSNKLPEECQSTSEAVHRYASEC